MEDDVTGVMNRDAVGCLFYAIAILLVCIAAASGVVYLFFRIILSYQ